MIAIRKIYKLIKLKSVPFIILLKINKPEKMKIHSMKDSIPIMLRALPKGN